MDALTGAVQVVAIVIAVGGVTKLVAPSAFSTLLKTLGLPSGPVVARAFGLAELALGATAVLVGGRLAAAGVAVAYAVFAVVVVAARRVGAPSCGCFGATAAPPSAVHVVVNVVSALVAFAAAVAGDLPSLATTLADQPWFGVPYLIALATAVWMTVTLNTVGAEVLDSMRQVTAMGPVFRENSGASTAPSRTVLAPVDSRTPNSRTAAARQVLAELDHDHAPTGGSRP